jgi:NAD(P)-dependent dehydrogenase (short-subunit alcohol dehydrogenase family)
MTLPPSLAPDELRRLTRALEAIVLDRALLAPLTDEERKALLSAAGRVSMPERDARARLKRAAQRLRKAAVKEKDRTVRNTTRIRTLRREVVFSAPALPGPAPEPAPERMLEEPRICYVCKASYRALHFFYDALCIPCGDFNHARRFQRAKLEGKVALVTGARVKIGFQVGLMLLRSGAQLVVTTRFPNDAALRYAREPDFADWSHRLQIHGLDLRHAPSVELFTQYLDRHLPRLDILINNAAQTVRRPPAFYRHLLEGETQRLAELPLAARPLLASHQACIGATSGARRLEGGGAPDGLAAPSWRSHDPSLGLHSSAALSQVPYAFEQQGDDDALFPRGRVDADLQQVDLRAVNSWRLTLSEVQTAEMLEVHLVNAVAPFILCSKLKPLMCRDRREPGHIVNVSAMEGIFSRGTKTDKHPHTNMAKAALNMMTLTSAPDYAKSNIFMNAVDTGWVTDEDPAAHAERKVKDLDFQPPLDIVDGAARIVDPVFASVRTGEVAWGNFFKDYKPSPW